MYRTHWLHDQGPGRTFMAAALADIAAPPAASSCNKQLVVRRH